MRIIYNRIDEDRMSLKEGNDLLFEIRNAIEPTDVEYIDDIDELCEELNKENIYDCGTSFYVIEDTDSRTDILVKIYGN
jgi:hypothetical protein